MKYSRTMSIPTKIVDAIFHEMAYRERQCNEKVTVNQIVVEVLAERYNVDISRVKFRKRSKSLEETTEGMHYEVMAQRAVDMANFPATIEKEEVTSAPEKEAELRRQIEELKKEKGISNE
jgi:hypothetical protein